MSKLILSPVIKERENKRWNLTSNPVMSPGQAIVCPYVGCGKMFSEPIELTVRAKGSHEIYYACPYCFSRVNIPENPKKDLSEAPLGALKDSSKDTTKVGAVNCGHFLGYLKTRPKDAPIPDECLTCASVLKCM